MSADWKPDQRDREPSHGLEFDTAWLLAVIRVRRALALVRLAREIKVRIAKIPDKV